MLPLPVQSSRPFPPQDTCSFLDGFPPLHLFQSPEIFVSCYFEGTSSFQSRVLSSFRFTIGTSCRISPASPHAPERPPRRSPSSPRGGCSLTGPLSAALLVNKDQCHPLLPALPPPTFPVFGSPRGRSFEVAS